MVALSLLTPPSPLSPALPHCSGVVNLFRDGVEKRLSDLPSTGYSPAKKKGGCRPRGAGISPRDIDAFKVDVANDDAKDGDNSPTPAYKATRATTQLKRRDKKVILDSSYFFYLRPLTFDTKRLS